MKTVDTNYHLPNSEGTRGFVDVLARDRHGKFVVIEIKRSDSTAREAIHEVLKYCELLRSQRGLRRDQVRAVIASNTWRELLVPFSEISRVSEYPVEGVELVVDESFPASLRASIVSPLDVPDERELSTLALRIPLRSPQEASQRWADLAARLAQVGVDDAIGVVVGNASRTLLHVALGTVLDGDPRLAFERPSDARDDDSERDEQDDELFSGAPEGQEREYAAALRVLEDIPEGEVVSPERLNRIIYSNRLELHGVLRSGRFEEQADLIDDEEALRLAEGVTSWNQVMVTLTGRPSHVLAWSRLRRQVEYVLFGNPRWSRLLGLWLDEVEHVHPSADVVLHVYNPCDLMAALVHSGLGGDLQRLLPRIEGGLDLPGTDGRLLQGTLVWDGTPVGKAEAKIRGIYRRPGDWGIARAAGGVWQIDLELLKGLGLRYDLFEFGPGEPGSIWRLEEENGTLRRELSSDAMEWPNCRPLSEWLRRVDLRRLMEQYRSIMVPVEGGDQWLVMEGPANPKL